MGLFGKLNKGLKKTRDSMSGAIDSILRGKSEVDDEFYDDLEEILITGDVGVATAAELTEALRTRARKQNLRTPEQVKEGLREIVAEMLSGGEELDLITQPAVILVIGVNGVGKTTSIGKLAAMFREDGKKVLLGAADTFRAAATEQLMLWAERTNVPIIKHNEGADPAAVVFDAASAAKARGVDVLLIDTAGRLHNKKNLMEELKKIARVLERELPGFARETLLVLDATTGQNAIAQAKEFQKAADCTGIVLTKLDGTAKGGIAVAIKGELGVPVRFVGVGESAEDLQAFDAEAYAGALFL